MATLDDRSWMHLNLTGKQAEELLSKEGRVGSFLTRYSQSDPGSYRLSVRLPESIMHIKIQNEGDGFVVCLSSGPAESFETLPSLIKYYMVGGEGYGLLKERNGEFVELKYPLPTSDHSTERFFHRDISGEQATAMLEPLKPGFFLVRPSQTQQGNFVLAVRTDDDVTKVLHVQITFTGNMYDIGDGIKQFSSLSQLVNYYRGNPIVNKSNIRIQLKQAIDRTRFRVSHLDLRIAQLDKLFVINGEERDGFWEEFEYLEKQAPDLADQNCVSGKLPENKKKNRYKNILPYEHTRVRLKDVDRKVVGSDYINANYVLNHIIDQMPPDRLPKYIAAQGCLQNTIAHFWQMIWQENCSVIVMLTELTENGKLKCVQYWPFGTAPTLSLDVYGGHVMTVDFQSERQEGNWTFRTFKLKKESSKGKLVGSERLVYQYHYTSWPDKKVPTAADVASVVELIKTVNNRWSLTNSSAPLVVHCSAGIGRTGTYIAIDILIRQIELQGSDCEIDVATTIQMLRTQRAGLVQVWHQYRFIYIAIQRFLAQKNPQRAIQPSGSLNVYANVPSLTQTSGKPPPPPVVSRSQKPPPPNQPQAVSSATVVARSKQPLSATLSSDNSGVTSPDKGIYENCKGQRPATLSKKSSFAK